MISCQILVSIFYLCLNNEGSEIMGILFFKASCAAVFPIVLFYLALNTASFAGWGTFL